MEMVGGAAAVGWNGRELLKSDRSLDVRFGTRRRPPRLKTPVHPDSERTLGPRNHSRPCRGGAGRDGHPRLRDQTHTAIWSARTSILVGARMDFSRSGLTTSNKGDSSTDQPDPGVGHKAITWSNWGCLFCRFVRNGWMTR